MGIPANGKFKITLIGSAKSYDFIVTSAGKVYEAGKRYTANIPGTSGIAWAQAFSEFRFTIHLGNSSSYTIYQKAASTSPANLTIEWGDGTTTDFAKGDQLQQAIASHNTYTMGNTYTITIRSDQADPSQKQLPELRFKGGGNSGDKEVKAILDPFPNMEATDFNQTFKNATNLTSIPSGLFRYNPNATSFRECFHSCNALTTIPERLFFYNPNATDFYQCFYSCKNLVLVTTMFPNPATEPNFL
ncbi:MAG TPA: hypothetical protein PK979_02395 [Bacteroidales bacterium]|jgi:hypothetical protein|nr:hypothetical protein [Bacteroidales bacterium]HPK29874.1 hypothetical protein [Bacteroidales bacterium]